MVVIVKIVSVIKEKKLLVQVQTCFCLFLVYSICRLLQCENAFNVVFCLLLQKRPPDNAFYVRTCSENPKKTRWWYHGR